MSATNRLGKVPIKFLLWGLIAIWGLFVVPKVSAQTYDFEEGLEVVTKGLISKNRESLKNKKIAVFGIIESRSKKKWEVSSHIEDGIVDALVNNGYRVIERRRIQDVIKKEIKKVTDQWFDQARVAQFGKLVGADFVVTGRYVLWGQGMLKISIRAINVADGEIVAADKVKVHTDRIANLLKSEEKKKHLKVAKVSPEKPVVKPATEERKTTLSINANVSDAKVLVDGREIGRTPLSDVTVSPGERKITVEKQGYEPYRKTIRLGKGRSISLYVDLRETRPRKGRLYVETEPDDANVKRPTGQKPVHPEAENRSILTRGWDIFTEPLSYGEVKWQTIGNKTFEVSFQLKSARPNHTYTVGAHFFNPDNLRENFTVNGFIGYTLGNKAGMVVREGNSAYVFGYDFGRLTTDSQGNGSARFIGNIPRGKYALQYTVRIGECFPSKGITSGCGAVFRSGKRFAENLVTINTQSRAEVEVMAESDTPAKKFERIVLTPTQTRKGIYSIQSKGDSFHIMKTGISPGGLQNAGMAVRTEDLGGPVMGDFKVSVHFSNTNISGGLNQIELQTIYEGGKTFVVVRDKWGNGCHVWAPGIRGNVRGGNSGTLRIVRKNDLVTGYCDEQTIWSTTIKQPLALVKFYLQNNGSHDPISVTFSDFKFIKGGGLSEERIPNISGKWKINFNRHLGVMEISGGSGHYSGRLKFGSWEEMLDLTIKGNRISFRRAVADQRYQGTIGGSNMKGIFSQGGSGEYPWTAELKR